MLDYLLTAIALILVLEGILPFLCPECWRRYLFKMAEFPNRAIRITALISMAIGVIILFLIHHQFI